MNREGIPQTGTTPSQTMLCSNSSSLLPVVQWFLWLLNNHLKVLRFLCNATISYPVCVGTGPVSVLPRLMDQLIISAIRVCFVPGVGARSEYRVTARGIRGIIPAQTSSTARLVPVSCNCNYHHHRHRTKNTTSIPPNPSNLQFKPHVSKLTFSGRQEKSRASWDFHLIMIFIPPQ